MSTRQRSLTFFMLFVAAACLAGGCGQQPVITLGDSVEVTSVTVDTAGGVITVDDPGDVLDGMSIEVPAGAYAAATTFAISYRPILTHSLGDDFIPLVPYIEIDNGGTYAEGIMKLTIPVAIAEGEFVMAFYYDETTNSLEGLPTFAQDEQSLKIMTRHFSGLTVAAKKPDQDYTKLLNDKYESAFTPGSDDWQIKNEGSYIAPGGYCSGMSLSAAWYFIRKKSAGEQKLNGAYDNKDYTTANFWVDDERAIRLCSVVQNDVAAVADEKFLNEFQKVKQGDLQTYLAFARAFEVTARPQLMYLRDTTNNAQHTVICYKAENRTLYLADPNYAVDTTRTVTLTSNNTFGTYQSGGYTYDKICYKGTTAIDQLEKIAEHWGNLEDGDIGLEDLDPLPNGALRTFPGYTLRVVERDAAGNVTDEYALDLVGGTTTSDKTLEATLGPGFSDDQLDFEGQVTIFRWDEVSSAKKMEDITAHNSPLELQPGENRLGFLVQGKVGNAWLWVGFDWATVTYKEEEEPDIASTTTTTIASADQRFIDNGDGTVTDTLTEVIWLKNANPCLEGKTWADAGTYCSSLKSGMAGLTDGSTPGQWRLPSVQELEGIGTDPPTTYCIDDKSCTAMVCPVPWTIPRAPFTDNAENYIYWSNASYIDNTDYAWTVFMYNGYVDFDFKPYSRSTVWPVRGGN